MMLSVLAAAMATIRARRTSPLARIRREWGKPVHRPHRIEAIVATHRARVDEYDKALTFVDDRTWADLNLDDVFAAVDRTQSTLGQHALYHRLRTSPVGSHMNAFEALVDRMSVDASARERAQLALSRLQDPHGYDLWWLGRPDALEIPSWYIVFPVLSAITLTLALMGPFWPGMFSWLLGVLLLNVAIWLASPRRVSDVTRAFRQLAPVIATAESLQFLQGSDFDVLTNSLQSDVTGLRRLKTTARWVSEDPFMLAGSWNVLAVAATDLANLLYLYLSIILHLDEVGVYFGARDLHTGGPAVVRVVAALGEIDAALSVASYRAEQGAGWTKPRVLSPGLQAELTAIRHPLVERAVPNTIAITPGHGALVTGSNMSGKSTFLRTVGVTTLMAQTLNTCLAAKYEAPILEIRTSIGRADDLLAGKSYYIVEVERLLELVRASNQEASQLFLLDELFRGTNAVERVAAGQAVLYELIDGPSGSKPHVVMAATHDGELVDLLQDRYSAYHFGDAVGTAGLVFDHRLQSGPATSRNAIALLRLHGAPPTLVDRALSSAADLDRQRGVTLTAR